MVPKPPYNPLGEARVLRKSIRVLRMSIHVGTGCPAAVCLRGCQLGGRQHFAAAVCRDSGMTVTDLLSLLLCWDSPFQEYPTLGLGLAGACSCYRAPVFPLPGGPGWGQHPGVH